MKKWPRKILLQKIRQLKELDIDLSASYIRKNDPRLFRAGCRRYSNWANALKAAGAGYPLEMNKKFR